MSGGALHYYEYRLDILAEEIDAYAEHDYVDEETSAYMHGLVKELKALHTKIKKLDYYLSGDSTEYK
jgi:hypothetical protein